MDEHSENQEQYEEQYPKKKMPLYVKILLLQFLLQFLLGPIMILSDIPMFITGLVPILLPVFFRYVLKRELEGYNVIILTVISIFTTYMIPYLSSVLLFLLVAGGRPLAP
jgi:hypothetical protein